ncbi:MAG: sensor histidine kinase [Anaeromicrobium sp.]|uniref:sensor histidine kinase n=1 Tax=Anaeromicrobium sp. TaxID=1929132 RepID=UPI0025F60F4A|nr:sensor histidine kinase [Anaeromicrobium sp.]MCT4596059.1 sensor histidine kinase [Anaeromicrobium sp.]
MNIIYDFIRNRGIKFQLLTYFIAFTLLTISILGSIGIFLYSKAVEEEINVYTNEMLNQIKNNIDFYIKDMDNTIYYLSQDPKIISFMNGNKDHATEKDIKSILERFENINKEIAGILLINKRDSFISNKIKRVTRDPLTREDWYMKSVKSPQSILLFSKPIGRRIQTKERYSADEVVSITKAVKDPLNDDVIGVILIDMKLDTIKKVIKDIQLEKKGFVYIVDSDENIVYTPVNSIVHRIKSNWFNGDENKRLTKRIRENNYQIIYNYSNYTKWKTVGVFSLDENQKVIITIKFYTIIIAIGILAMGIIIGLIFTSTIANPIEKLTQLMIAAEEGDLNVRFNSKYNDEIGKLGNTFNKMLEKIKNLINLVYIEQKRKREAELRILEAQIKPHFLYNTLDTIQWMAQEYDADDIIEMVTALTNLFRLGLNKGKEIIKIKDELKHIESYLTIQMARYEEKFHYEIEYDEELLNYKVIKIIIQPFVENAIYHGIRNRREKGHISISIKRIEDKISFVIKDDGIGIGEGQLNTLNEILKGNVDDEDGQTYGIFNVNERIKLTYGEEYGVEIKSTLGKGTTVNIVHPILD